MSGDTWIYEEPSNPFDREAWVRFRDDMMKEVRLQPKRGDAKTALKMAEKHLVWLRENQPDYGIVRDALGPEESMGIWHNAIGKEPDQE